MSKYNVKDKLIEELVYIDEIIYEGRSYSYYDDGIRYLMKFIDNEGNVYVYRKDHHLGIEYLDERGHLQFEPMEVGDKVLISGTVKDVSEYKGEEQTVLTRCKLEDILKHGYMSEQEINQYKRDKQLGRQKGNVEVKTVTYRDYKNKYSDLETIYGSFVRNDEGSFIDVIVPEGYNFEE